MFRDKQQNPTEMVASFDYYSIACFVTASVHNHLNSKDWLANNGRRQEVVTWTLAGRRLPKYKWGTIKVVVQKRRRKKTLKIPNKQSGRSTIGERLVQVFCFFRVARDIGMHFLHGRANRRASVCVYTRTGVGADTGVRRMTSEISLGFRRRRSNRKFSLVLRSSHSLARACLNTHRLLLAKRAAKGIPTPGVHTTIAQSLFLLFTFGHFSFPFVLSFVRLRCYCRCSRFCRNWSRAQRTCSLNTRRKLVGNE